MKTLSPSLFARIQGLSSFRKTLLTVFALCSGLLLVSWFVRPPIRHSGGPATTLQPPGAALSEEQIDAKLRAQWEGIKENSRVMAPVPSARAGGNVDYIGGPAEYATPLIAHAAELTVATKEFPHSRATLEEILERHHGYVAKLRMVGQPAGSLLTATLRVPSSEFTGAVNDLKTLGNVEREEQTADEITQQRANLDAQLTNAQGRQARLQGILAKGGLLVNPAEIQRQLSAVSGEITRLEAERVAAEHRVIFAQVLFSLREEVNPPVESIGAQFRSAAISGLSDALSAFSAIAIFAIGRGPVILLWVGFIYFPVRWAWRKWRPAEGQGTEMA